MSERPTDEKVADAAALGRETAPASWPIWAAGRKAATEHPPSHRDLVSVMGANHCEQTLVRGALPYLALQGSEQCGITAMQQVVDGYPKLASKRANQRTGRNAPAMFPLPDRQVMRTAQPFSKLLLRKFTS